MRNMPENVFAIGPHIETARGVRSTFAQGRSVRVFLSAVLTNAGTYGVLFWGMQTVPSGLSGLINLALIPVLLFALAALVGEERPTWQHALGRGLGCAGKGKCRLERADLAV